jgi:hypothetical protein
VLIEPEEIPPPFVLIPEPLVLIEPVLTMAFPSRLTWPLGELRLSVLTWLALFRLFPFILMLVCIWFA